eukprot:CAMPEP_0172585014 /NCGR_PEP_ID=MMETSP1068-20121228/4511_1 /TAXON_ID=35684 /ORGANISM="Pseudopedinella elastica, Strain CCMP716" /LENGTH=255 /DNA_ID=CAMNT_0013379345 /DNA_START=159 /DNA_END=923 /DNA_ORIENTATION=+
MAQLIDDRRDVGLLSNADFPPISEGRVSPDDWADDHGVVFVPKQAWLLAQLTCAASLSIAGVAQLIVGLIILNFDTLTGDSGHTCGATTVAASVTALATALLSALIWKMIRPSRRAKDGIIPTARAISRFETSWASDPRRWSLALCAVALPLCLMATVTDGVDCVAPLEAIDDCTPDSFGGEYPECSITGAEGKAGAHCACVTFFGRPANPAGEDGLPRDYTCSYFTKGLPEFLAIGSSGSGSSCDHLMRHLIAW